MAEKNHFERLYAAFGMVPNAAEVVCILPHDGLMCRLVYVAKGSVVPFGATNPAVEITFHYQKEEKKVKDVRPYVGPRRLTLVQSTNHLYWGDFLYFNLAQVGAAFGHQYGERNLRLKAFADFLQEAGLRRINAKAKLCKAWVMKIG